MYKRFDPEDVVIGSEIVSTPIWSEDVVTLRKFFKSDKQKQGYSGTYYLDVYNSDPKESTTGSVQESGSDVSRAKVQFGISFADKHGRGALLYSSGSISLEQKSPSSTIYGQYRSLVLGDEDSKFVFGSIRRDPISGTLPSPSSSIVVNENETGKENRHFYAITIDRARYKEKLVPGTLTLKLFRNQATSSEDPQTFREDDFITLTDESPELKSEIYVDSGRVYNLVSGSAINGIYHENQSLASYGDSGSYGYFLPDIGVILLNGEALDDKSKWGINLGSNLIEATGNQSDFEDSNTEKLLNALNGSTEPASGSGEFTVQSEETVTSNYVFVRARNAEFNYSTNPSNIVGSGELRHDSMINSPQAFITSVGLYNDDNDLLAIAKLSRPLLKDFTKEALIRIKLDY